MRERGIDIKGMMRKRDGYEEIKVAIKQRGGT